MTVLQAIILGIVEGITEFLPISSTGHLIIAAKALAVEQSSFLTTFEIAIQLGAILAVLFLYWRRLLLDKDTFIKVLCAFIPTAVIGLLAYPIVKSVLLGSTTTVLYALFLGGVAIIIFEYMFKEKEGTEVKDITIKQAVSIGLFQSLAIVPGVSRAAATILGGIGLGLSRRAIVEFSFLLAIPTMAAATGLDLLKTAPVFTAEQIRLLLIGCAVSFVVALAAVKFLLKFIQQNDFKAFGYYRIAFAILAFILLFNI
ncbi:MAG: undecaprenyl-diphosphate phosphatase [Candidatus Paceibacterota bacterium]